MKRKPVFIWTTAAVLAVLLAGCGKTTTERVQKWKDTGNIPKLITATDTDSDQDIRFAAIDALGDLKAEAAVEPLAALFTDHDYGVVLHSIEAMASIGTASAQNHLIEVFELEAPRGWVVAAKALGDQKALHAAEPLIKELDNDYEPLAVAAATSLGQLDDPKAIEPLSAKIQSRSQPLRLACATSLASIGGADTIPGLVLALGDISEEVRTTAIAALASLGKPCVPVALEALRSNDKLIRQSGMAILETADAIPSTGNDFIWYLLSKILVKKKTAEINPDVVQQIAEQGVNGAQALLEAAAFSVPEIREHAIRALEQIGEPCAEQAVAAAEAHAGAAGKEWFNERSAWEGAPSWRIDLWGASTALNPNFELNEGKVADLKTKDKAAREVMSSSKFKPTREYIPLLIAQLAYRFVPPVMPEKELLEQSSVKESSKPDRSTIHLQAAMKHLVSAGELAIPPLIAALDASDPQVADYCAEVLGEIGDKRALLPLIKTLSRKVAAGEELSHSPFCIALQKLNDPSSESILLKIRPNAEQAMRIFKRQYPGSNSSYTKTHNAKAPYSQPVAFTLGYIRDGKVGEMQIIFKKDENGDWIPTPPLPDNLPQ